MSARTYAPKLIWTPGNPIADEALRDALMAWNGTPYESGQCFIGRGADCVGAVFGVIDQIDGRQRAAQSGMPHDAAMHNRPGALAAMRELVRRYMPNDKVEPVDGVYYVEPGDIVATGEPGGGPGHVELVGANKNELWHAVPGTGFHQGGWSLLSHQVLYAIYRISDKYRWGQ